MNRRAFLTICGGALASGAISALAQSPAKVHRAALLSTSGPVTDDSSNGKALIGGLVRRGYAPGSNLVFDRRGAEARMERLPRLLDELLDNKPDVLVTFGYPAALIAKQRNTSRLANQQGPVPV